MSDSQSPKLVATINFKGGVGKTTITWCLADTLALFPNQRVLVSDLDAQMSLTQAITLNEDNGRLEDRFGKWYDISVQRKKTIFDAIEAFTRPAATFNFPVGFDVIYQISDQLHFIPSVEDLYWLELEIFDRDSMRDFIRRFVGKISNSPKMPKYDYILFDCPPSFTLLSYSVLTCADLLLIPVNPDFFASRGTSLILNSLKMRIEPHPLPKIGVFMNKTKTFGRDPATRGWRPTNESAFYMREVRRVCEEASKSQKINVRFFDSFVRERVGIKRAITGGGVPSDLVPDFRELWQEAKEFLAK
jgi:chromosome partitioning protein